MSLELFPARAEGSPGVHSIWKTSEHLSVRERRGICREDKGACSEVPRRMTRVERDPPAPGWENRRGQWGHGQG